MYGIKLVSGGFIRSAELQRALADLPFECGTELHSRRMQHLGAIESLEARGMHYSNQDFDVLSSALNFLAAVAIEAADGLRDRANVAALRAPYDDLADAEYAKGNIGMGDHYRHCADMRDPFPLTAIPASFSTALQMARVCDAGVTCHPEHEYHFTLPSGQVYVGYGRTMIAARRKLECDTNAQAAYRAAATLTA